MRAAGFPPVSIVAICFALPAWPCPAARADDKPAIDAALAYGKLMSQGKYEEAYLSFEPTLRGKISAEKLKSAWESLGQQLGDFRSFEKPTVESVVKYTVVSLPANFARGRVRVQVAVNEHQRIVGMFFQADTSASKPGAVPPPPTVVQRDMTIGSGEWKLPGTLTLPKDGKPRAAVLLVHGSGPNDRDETIGFNTPFRDLAWGLGEQGVATLRYDKRTLAHRDKMLNMTITLRDEVIDDALAGIAAMRARPELAGVPIYLLGHSLGGSLAPEIAATDGRLAGVILMAGVARPFGEVLIDQATYLSSFRREPATMTQLDELKRTVALLEAKKLKPGETLLGADATYWYDLGKHDAATALKYAEGLKCRVLVLQGGRDYQATAEDFNLWQKALVNNPKATFKMFDDLNHLFGKGKGKATPQEYTAEGKPMDARVIHLIAEWCAAK